MNRMDRLPRAVKYSLVAIAGLCFAASYGFNFGFDNQLVYFLKSLVLTHHELLRSDWFTHHTTHYHRTFIYLGALLLKLNARGWGVAIAQFVCVFLGARCACSASCVEECVRRAGRARVPASCSGCCSSLAPERRRKLPIRTRFFSRRP